MLYIVNTAAVLYVFGLLRDSRRLGNADARGAAQGAH